MANINRRPKGKILRAGLIFDKEILEIQRMRAVNGVASPRDRTTNSTPKITNLIVKHKLFPQIKHDISEVNFKDLKGDIFNAT